MKDLHEKYNVFVGKEKVEVSPEVEKAYRNMQDTYRIRQYRRGECHCPKAKRLSCDTDCATCPYRNTTNIYLDGLCNEEDENYSGEFLALNSIDGYTSFEDSFVETEVQKAIILRLGELMPELIKYGELKMKGYTNDEISKILGIKRSTMDSRRAKAYKIIQEEFPEIRF